MIMNTRKKMLAVGIALATFASASTQAAESVSQEVTEARQEAQIWTTYALSPYLSATAISVSVQDGKATLTGNVEDGVHKDLAKQIALGVDGIKSVDNQIVVQADYVAPKRGPNRSYGETVDDASITASVKSKLAWNRYTSATDTNVTTESGKVTLTGKVEDENAKTIAGKLALNTRGVVSVDNELTIEGKSESVSDSAKKTADKAGDNIADAWITTKVMSTFMYSSNVDASDIKVTTENGVVTLTGKADSGAERALAIELAQNIRGVKTVESTGLTI